MDEKNLKSAQYEDIDPTLFWTAVNDSSDDLRKVIESESVLNDGTDSSSDFTRIEENVVSDIVEVIPALSEETSTLDVVSAIDNTDKNLPKEEEVLAEVTKQEPKEKSNKKTAKKKEKTPKISIEEQYQGDENGARVRFHKWKWNNAISNIFLVVSSSIFLICAIELGVYFYSSYKYTANMSELQEGMGGGIENSDLLAEVLKNQENRDPIKFPDEEEYTIVARPNHSTEISDTWKTKYAYLTSVNPDCVGYITIPDTVLNYPVMFTPEDYLYYLYRNFSGEYEYRGTPFLDYQTRLGQSQNIIVYGHNMNDGMMFGTLREYLSKDYYEQHKYVYFNTAVSEGIYEIMAVVKTKIYNVDDKCFKYYKYGGVLTKDQFETYVKEMKAMSQYNTGVTAAWGDELISLSTCNRYTEDGRLVIVCKRIN